MTVGLAYVFLIAAAGRKKGRSTGMDCYGVGDDSLSGCRLCASV